MDATASLDKEMRGKDYDLEGVNSRSSKINPSNKYNWKDMHDFYLICHHKKIAIDFSQDKKDLIAECKKTALLELRLREMESALAARTTPKPLTFIHLLSSANAKSVNITTPATNQDTNLPKKLIPN